MDSLSELLTAIRRRPGMYLGKPCPIRLQVFVQGWLTGKGAENVADATMLNGFHVWIAKRYHIKSSHSWAEIISFFSVNNSEAFDKTYELLDQYEKESGDGAQTHL